ncbi:hypothetical protein V5F53_09090 [Xanthobacter sp. V4C-4]|uniref:hypothetical protein n=1 Tax=Xanthobacter cornucopiae TaxID=3119924 RepID=UPI00372A20D1
MLPPECDLNAAGAAVGPCLRLAGHALNLPYVGFARLGQLLLVDMGRESDGLYELDAPRLFATAAALRQRLSLADVWDSAAFRDTRLGPDGPAVRAFASVPVLSVFGTSLGALCAAGVQPRRLDATGLRPLEDGARVLAALLAAQGGAEAR